MNAVFARRSAGKDLVRSEFDGEFFRIVIDRPGRANALVPELVAALRDALVAGAEQRPRALVLAARGKAFSTGGDIGGFLEHAESREALRAYSSTLVGLLNETILSLLAFPAPVIAVVQGPVTGGSAGILFASDIVLMSETAFLQPYYVEVGFAPDGGWTALLPDRVGAARALEIQMLNRRIAAREAEALGLVSTVVPDDRLEDEVAERLEGLRRKEIESLRTTRALVWDERSLRAIAARLEAERERFIELVERPEVIARMRAFAAR